MKVCIVGASGKLGRYMVQHALDRGYEVVGMCREQSVGKLDPFQGRITIVPGATDDREVIRKAVDGCDGVLTVLAPWGVRQYSSGTAQAVLDLARPDARPVFSCGWHITRDGQDVYSRRFRCTVAVFGWLARLMRFAELDDQVEACRRIFASDRRWTVVRGSDLEEGESQGLPVWSWHVGDPILESNLTRRVDFVLFMVAALENDELIHEAPAIVGRQTPSALAHADTAGWGSRAMRFLRRLVEKLRPMLLGITGVVAVLSFPVDSSRGTALALLLGISGWAAIRLQRPVERELLGRGPAGAARQAFWDTVVYLVPPTVFGVIAMYGGGLIAGPVSAVLAVVTAIPALGMAWRTRELRRRAALAAAEERVLLHGPHGESSVRLLE